MSDARPAEARTRVVLATRNEHKVAELGAILADVVARTAMSPAELPIGVVTAAIGAPFFCWMLFRMRGRA